ncbi:MAG: Do family serine endopeptidase [Rhodocyclaceae bacterium]|nr:Do family serine endopeptidase [Rhodocyclaceae bacterium]
MRRIWLVFSQAVTVSVAILFVLATLKPEWLGRSPNIIALQEIAPGSAPAALHGPVSYGEAAKKALPSVVHIFTRKDIKVPRHPLLDDPLFRRFFGDQVPNESRRQSGLGSGVIVSPDGYILTNNHVVEAADEIEVALNNGRKFAARVVGADPDSDLAVLRIEAGQPLPAITMAASDGQRVGDVVLAIGNPFGVGQTVTMGIISALGRSHLGINTFENFIQTDAAINPGNSGGALVDTNGNLIGINAAIYSQSGGSLGIGFAIPMSLARNIMEQIIRNGTVTRGWIGVEAQEITPDLAESFNLPATQGALIAGVMRGGPADRAGIRPGDILTSVQGTSVPDPQTMIDLIAALRPGQAATVHLRRERLDMDVRLEIGRRPKMAKTSE